MRHCRHCVLVLSKASRCRCSILQQIWITQSEGKHTMASAFYFNLLGASRLPLLRVAPFAKGIKPVAASCAWIGTLLEALNSA